MVARYSIFPSLSTCSILQPLWYFVHDSTTITTPSIAPPPPSKSFASTDDISKELLASYEAGWGRRLIWIKLDRRVDTALKVSRPFMSRWQGVCVCWEGGGGGHRITKEAYLKAGVYLRQGNEKEWTTKLAIFQIRPVTSSLFPFHTGGGYIRKVGSEYYGMACRTCNRKITYGHKVDHRGLGVQRKALQCPPIVVPCDLC